MRNTANYKSLPFNPALKKRAQELRKAGIMHEALLWNQLKGKKLNGLDFDRQKIIGDERLDASGTKAFIDNAFRDGAIPATGTAITKILPPVSRFNQNNSHGLKKRTALDKLGAFFERFFGLIWRLWRGRLNCARQMGSSMDVKTTVI